MTHLPAGVIPHDGHVALYPGVVLKGVDIDPRVADDFQTPPEEESGVETKTGVRNYKSENPDLIPQYWKPV